MILQIIELINSVIIIKLSLLFSILIGLVKLTFSYQNQNALIYKLTVNVQNYFIKSLKFSLISNLLLFAFYITNKFFNLNKLFAFVTVISGLSLGFSLICRILLLNGYTFLGQTWFLLFFATNALFRAIITLGLTLKTGGSLWRQLLEHTPKSRSGFPGVGITNNSPNNSNEPHNNFQFNTSQQQEESERRWRQAESEQKKRDFWGRVGAIGSVSGAIFTFFSLSNGISSDHKNTYDRRASENTIARITREKSVAEELCESLYKDKQEAIKYQENAEKVIQDLLKKNEAFEREKKLRNSDKN